MHFDEKSMFAGDKKGAKSLKVKSLSGGWGGHSLLVVSLSCASELSFPVVHLVEVGLIAFYNK